MGFQVLVQHLDDFFNYESNFLNYRKSTAEAVHGKQKAVIKPMWTDVTMWAVLAGQPGVAKLLWKRTTDPLRVALMASLQCQIAAAEQDGALADELSAQANEYQQWACGMLDASGSLDHAERATLLMAFPVRKDEKSWDGTQEMWPDSPFELAVGGKSSSGETVRCEQVIAHRYAIEFFTNIFNGFVLQAPAFDDDDSDSDDSDDEDDKTGKKQPGGAKSDNSYFNDETNDWIQNEQMEESQVPFFGKIFFRSNQSNLKSFAAFWNVPKVKYVLHTVFSLSYLVLLIVQLNKGVPWVTAEWMMHEGLLPRDIPGEELFNYVWAVCRLLDGLKQMRRVGREEYEQSGSWGLSGALAYFSSGGNLLDCFNLGTVLLIALLRILFVNGVFQGQQVCWPAACDAADVFVLRLCQSLYAIVTITIFMRFVDSLKFFQGFGVLYLTLLKMLVDVLAWFNVTLVITIGFGVAYTVLMPAGSSIAQTNGNFLGRPFFQPFWGILGDFDAASVLEYYSVEEFPASTLMPLLLWVYNFLTTIVLVNLLIAQMSARYEIMQEVGYNVWLAERINLIKEFKDERDPLPPPLNIIRICCVDVPSLFSKCLIRGKKNTDFMPGNRSGFKLELRGQSINHAKTAALQLCEDYLQQQNEAETESSKMDRVLESNQHLSTQVEVLVNEVARIKGMLSNAARPASPSKLESRINGKKTPKAKQPPPLVSPRGDSVMHL